eukprot:1143634-Pelagomonas_calceolata.AAC.3
MTVDRRSVDLDMVRSRSRARAGVLAAGKTRHRQAVHATVLLAPHWQGAAQHPLQMRGGGAQPSAAPCLRSSKHHFPLPRMGTHWCVCVCMCMYPTEERDPIPWTSKPIPVLVRPGATTHTHTCELRLLPADTCWLPHPPVPAGSCMLALESEYGWRVGEPPATGEPPPPSMRLP